MNDATHYQRTKLQRVSENLYRNQTSGTYYVWITSNGKQIKKSLQTKDRRLADNALLDFLNEIQGKELSNLSSGILFKDIAKEWMGQQYHMKPSSFNRTTFALNQLNPIFGDLELRKITPSLCQRWAATRTKARKASTYNKELSILKGVLNLAIEQGHIISNPAEKLKRGKVIDKERIIPTREQFQTILDTLRQFNARYGQAANLIELLGTSGMRLSEATAIRWDQINFDTDMFTISGGEKGTKNSRIRTVPLFPPLKKFLLRIRPQNPTGKIISVDSSKKALATACKHLKYPHITHHGLRHYFCSNCIESGVDFKTIAEWLGHSDGGILVAKTYGHLRQDHSKRMAKLLK